MGENITTTAILNLGGIMPEGLLSFMGSFNAAFWGAHQTLDSIIEQHPGCDPDLLILALPAASGRSLQLLQQINTNFPSTRVLVVTCAQTLADAMAFFRNGVHSILACDSSDTECRNALSDTIRGDSYISPRISRLLTVFLQEGARA